MLSFEETVLSVRPLGLMVGGTKGHIVALKDGYTGKVLTQYPTYRHDVETWRSSERMTHHRRLFLQYGLQEAMKN